MSDRFDWDDDRTVRRSRVSRAWQHICGVCTDSAHAVANNQGVLTAREFAKARVVTVPLSVLYVYAYLRVWASFPDETIFFAPAHIIAVFGLYGLYKSCRFRYMGTRNGIGWFCFIILNPVILVISFAVSWWFCVASPMPIVRTLPYVVLGGAMFANGMVAFNASELPEIAEVPTEADDTAQGHYSGHTDEGAGFEGQDHGILGFGAEASGGSGADG